jgi:ABC-type transport system involved in multi-copper enzyme maturation permease subunit
VSAQAGAAAGGPGQFSAAAGGPGQFSAAAGGPGQFSAAAGGVRLDSRLRATARSEWIKFRSVRSGPFALSATALTVVAGAWLLAGANRGSYLAASPAGQAAFDPVFTVLQAIELAQLFVGALGVVTVTGEYTSGLIRGTFLATPQRAQVLAMRALVFAVVAWACCTVMSVAAFFLGQGVLSPAKHAGIGDPGALTAVFGAGLYLTLIGLLGMFIGVLVRHTPATLAALFGILIVLPILFLSIIPGKITQNLGQYLPGQAGEQAFHLLHNDAHALGPWPGLGVLAAYVAVTAATAVALILRRDA